MDVSDTVPRHHYVATAAQTTFAVDFEFELSEYLAVFVNGALKTYADPPANSNEFKTTGEGVNGGGSIIFGAPGLSAGAKVVIINAVPIERSGEYSATGRFPIATLNADLARLTQQLLQVDSRQKHRSLTLAEYDEPESMATLPLLADRANKVLAFDADGDPVPWDTTQFIETIEDAAAAAAQEVVDEAIVDINGIISAATASLNGIVSNALDDINDEKAIIAGYRDEVEADRIDVQADKVIASQAATDAAAALLVIEAIQSEVEDMFADFEDDYLGKFDELPMLDNDGSALEGGEIAFATGLGSYAIGMYVYSIATTEWLPGFAAGGTFLSKSQNLGDLPSVSTARTNLDVYSKAQVDGYAHAAATKSTPVDADKLAIVDSAASNVQKGLTFANLWVWVQAKFNGTAKASPVMADRVYIGDSAASNAQKYSTLTQIMATLAANAWTMSGAGKITTILSATGGAGFNLPHGAAPTSPVNGDVWTTSAGGLWARINGVTRNFLHAADIGVTVQAYSASLQNIATTITAAISAAVGVTVQAFDAQLFSNIPVNSQSAAYTTVAADANKMIFHPATDTTARIWTIAANSSVAYPIGTCITFDNDIGAGVITIAINTDTLVLVGAVGSTGSRTLAAGGRATAVKVTSTRWRISGTGLT